MGMAMGLMMLPYLALVVMPASLAVLFALIKNARSWRFWLVGVLSSAIVYWGMPFLLIRAPDNNWPIGRIFSDNIYSPVSRGLVVVAMLSLIFSVAQLAQKKPNLPWLRGLTLGVGFASVYWLVLLFSN